MSNAFKCDSCGGFYEGRPQRFKVREYLSTGLGGWSDSNTTFRWELCDGCKEELNEMLTTWVGDSDD